MERIDDKKDLVLITPPLCFEIESAPGIELHYINDRLHFGDDVSLSRDDFKDFVSIRFGRKKLVEPGIRVRSITNNVIGHLQFRPFCKPQLMYKDRELDMGTIWVRFAFFSRDKKTFIIFAFPFPLFFALFFRAHQPLFSFFFPCRKFTTCPRKI